MMNHSLHPSVLSMAAACHKGLQLLPQATADDGVVAVQPHGYCLAVQHLAISRPALTAHRSTMVRSRMGRTMLFSS